MTVKTSAKIGDEERGPENVAKKKYDIAVITAIYEDEFENIKQILNLETLLENETNIFYSGDKIIEIEKDKTTNIGIIGLNQHKKGMVDAAILATEMIVKYDPKFLIMTGVCGGSNRDGIKLGDIIVANKIFLYQRGKVSENGFKQEIETIDIDEKLLMKIRQKSKNIIRSIEDRDVSRSSKYRDERLNFYIEPMACGDAVIDKDGYFKEKIEGIERKAVAVDMESYAIARVCQISNNRKTIPLIIKSVMDKTKGKDDSAKSYAAYTSALYLNFLIEEVLIEYLTKV